MPKKYYNKIAIGTYSAILLSASSFVFQFVYEDWGQMGLGPLQSPLGVAAIVIGLIAVILFVWNLRRDEIAYEQKKVIERSRRPHLNKLEGAIEDYIRATGELAQKNELHDLATYRFKGNSSRELLRIVLDNLPYSRLETEDRVISKTKQEIGILVSRLGSKKLEKRVDSLYKRDHTARVYSVYLSLYQSHYTKHWLVEWLICHSRSIGKLEKQLGRVHSYISTMRRLKDIE